MTQFNVLERRIARLLTSAPRAKAAAKAAWQRWSYLLNRPNFRRSCHYPIQSLGRPDSASFFGYYDHTPVSPDSRRLLWHETNADTARPPSCASAIDIVLADHEGTPLSRWPTRAFNWQQGARLQWVDALTFLYNDFDTSEQCYVTRLRDNEGRWLRDLTQPIYDASAQSGLAVSINFERLAQLRPDYGYFARSNHAEIPIPTDDEDGLWVVPLDGAAPHLAVSLSMLADKSGYNGDQHKVNHPMLDPSGQRCVFLYRVFEHGRRHDSLWLLDLATGSLTLLVDTGMVSHLVWYDAEWLIGYMRARDGRDGYYWLDRSGHLQPLAERKLDDLGDGHPSVNSRWVITDSYPDKARLQHLRLLNLDTGSVEHLGAFFHGFRYAGPQRCDLHPRFSPDGQAVFIDNVCEGSRRLYKIDLAASATQNHY